MRLGVIGYGAIGAGVLERLSPDMGVASAAVLVRPGREAAVPKEAGGAALTAVASAEALLAAEPDLVIECAGHAAAAAYGAAVLAAGVDLVLASVGALADPALSDALEAAARRGGARIILPAGAIGGLDAIAALSAAGPLSIDYRGVKPPAAWPAETAPAPDQRQVIFEGTAREAARTFPKNANVAAALALAGPGLDAVRVSLVSDPAARGNAHEVRVRSATADLSFRFENAPSRTASTSAATLYSVLREIRNRRGPFVI